MSKESFFKKKKKENEKMFLTQDLVHARPLLYLWATSLSQEGPF